MSPAVEEHEWLASHAGTYTAKMNAPFGESHGTSKIQSALGGLWNVTHFESNIMGQPFKGIEIMGYDPEKKKFVSVWVDSMKTKISTMEGTYDADAKTLTMKGKSTGMDGAEATMINTTEFGAKSMLFTMSIEGQPGSMMTIEYAREE